MAAPNLQDDEVLVPSYDHSYAPVRMRVKKVTWNPDARQYFEYHGDEFLEGNEFVVERLVAE